MITLTRRVVTAVALVVLAGTAGATWAADVPPAPTPPSAADAPPVTGGQAAIGPPEAAAPIPPRLSYSDGDVSFWRPGGEDWVPAQVNTPLAPGDQLYTGNRGNLELQIEARSFVRAWGDSQLGIENQTPDFLQLKVVAGHVSLDLRPLDRGRIVEVDTPDAAFTIGRPGYYRVDVTTDHTSFITRRGGVATMTSAGGQAASIATSEQVVASSTGSAAVQTFAAPELDVWDRWNYTRTEALIDTVSARYVSAGVSGMDDLDQYGNWRVVPEYGAVWVPEGVAADWAPYTTGRWIWDPRYGWTWVDTAPWGWAPYHYGRWVYLGHVWAWAPGPIVARPAYAPALVAFFGAPGGRVAVGSPMVSWVALGWGEPCVPWWGPAGFVGRPWWGGWGGPRVVNNVVVSRNTVVNVSSVTVYRNVSVRSAVVAVRPDRFGRGPVQEARIRQVDTRRLEPVRGAFDLRPDHASFAATGGRGTRPPERVLARPVVATRPPATRALPHAAEGRGPATHIVPAPRPAGADSPTPRPPFGQSRLERARPPRAPRFDSAHPAAAPPVPHRPESSEPQRAPTIQRGAEAPSTPTGPVQHGSSASSPPASRRARPEPPARPPAVGGPSGPRNAPSPRALPGEPANRLYPGRVQRPAPRTSESRPPADPKPAPQPDGASQPGPARPNR